MSGTKVKRLTRRSDRPEVKETTRAKQLKSDTLARGIPAEYLTLADLRALGLTSIKQAHGHAARINKCCAITASGTACSRLAHSITGICKGFCLQHIMHVLKGFPPPNQRLDVFPIWSNNEPTHPIQIFFDFRTYDPAYQKIKIKGEELDPELTIYELLKKEGVDPFAEGVNVRSRLMLQIINKLEKVQELYTILNIWNSFAPKKSYFQLGSDLDSDGYATLNDEIELTIAVGKWEGKDPEVSSLRTEFVPVESVNEYYQREWVGAKGQTYRKMVAKLALAFPSSFFGPWIPTDLEASTSCTKPRVLIPPSSEDLD